MATTRSSPVVSPATTHCSELEYLIALQETENSQPRRSQRLREKLKTPTVANENCGTIPNNSGSPQLFVETDGECSQLAQVLQAASQTFKQTITGQAEQDRHPNNRTQTVLRLPSAVETTVQKPKNWQTELTNVSLVQTPSDCKISTISEPMTISSKPPSKNDQPKKRRNKSLLTKRSRQPKKQPQIVQLPNTVSLETRTNPNLCKPQLATEAQELCNCTQKSIVTSLESGPTTFVRSRKRKTSSSTSVIKRKRLENCTPSEKNVTKPAHDVIGLFTKDLDQNCKQQSSVLPLTLNPNTFDVKTTESYTYHNLNETQSLLPARYPAHFIYQLPPSSNFKQEVTKQNNGLEAPMSSLSSAALREMCPTPDTTPLVPFENFSPSPPFVESVASTTPSLSESLAEVFGTKKIHEVLNIEVPQKYLVLENHLPAIALMLDVELARLRAVLELTQRLTLDQLQQITKESLDVMKVHSEQ